MAKSRRQFGRIRKLPSGRYQARYPDPDGVLRAAPETFESKRDADDWLAATQTALKNKDWRDPDAGAINFTTYAEAWITERDLMPTTDELYRRLLRLHLAPEDPLSWVVSRSILVKLTPAVTPLLSANVPDRERMTMLSSHWVALSLFR